MTPYLFLYIDSRTQRLSCYECEADTELSALDQYTAMLEQTGIQPRWKSTRMYALGEDLYAE